MTRWSSPSRAVRCASPLREPRPRPPPTAPPPPPAQQPPSRQLCADPHHRRHAQRPRLPLRQGRRQRAHHQRESREGRGERPWGRARPPPHQPPAFRWSPWSLGTCSSALAWATRCSSSTRRSCRRPLPAPSGRPTRCVGRACRDPGPGAGSPHRAAHRPFLPGRTSPPRRRSEWTPQSAGQVGTETWGWRGPAGGRATGVGSRGAPRPLQGASPRRRTRWMRLKSTAARPSRAHSWLLTLSR